MVEYTKEHGFMDMIKDRFSYISQMILAGIFPQISEGADWVIKNIERRIILIEKRMLSNISSLLIILFGGIFLVFGLFFFLIEFLSWSKATAFFSIGITVVVMGLILKLAGQDNLKDGR